MAPNKKSRKVPAAHTLQGLDWELRKHVASFLRPGDQETPAHRRHENWGGRETAPFQVGDIRVPGVYAHLNYRHTQDGGAEDLPRLWRQGYGHNGPSYLRKQILEGTSYEEEYKRRNRNHNEHKPQIHPGRQPPRPQAGAFARAGLTDEVKRINVDLARDMKLRDWIFDHDGRSLEDIPIVSGAPNLQAHRFDYHWDANYYTDKPGYTDRPRP